MNLIPIIRALSVLGWLFLLGAIALVAVRASRGRPIKGGGLVILVVAVLAAVLSTAAAGLVFVQPQELGVVITVRGGGVRPTALQPGLHWIIPFAESVVPYSVSRQTYTMSISTGEGQISGDDSVEARTSDGQVVFVDASIIYAIDPAKVVSIHINWQKNYTDGLVRPLSRGIIRNAVSGFGVEEVYSSKRADLTEQIAQELETKFEEEGVRLIDFVLRNITFSEEYAASVEQKQIAEQEAQRAAFVVEQRKQEAEQARQQAQGLADAAVIQAEGDAKATVIAAQAAADARLIQAEAEAEALRKLGEAIAVNPDVLILEYINKIAPNITVILLPSDSPFLFPLPTFGTEGSTDTLPIPK